jgi:hypothetical protein
MALPLNVFKTLTKVASTSPVGIYTAPIGYTGVILLAQVANISSSTYSVSFSHRRTTLGIAVTTEIVKDFAVQGNDSVSLVQGKLTLESGDTLLLSSNNATNIKFIGSILETLN